MDNGRWGNEFVALFGLYDQSSYCADALLQRMLLSTRLTSCCRVKSGSIIHAISFLISPSFKPQSPDLWRARLPVSCIEQAAVSEYHCAFSQ